MSASLTMKRRSHVAVEVTLTSADTAYNLLDLVNAVIAAEAKWDGAMVCPGNCARLVLQADPANADTTGGVLIGDSLISATRYGYDLLKTAQPMVYTAPINAIQFGALYGFSHTAGQKLSIEVMTF